MIASLPRRWATAAAIILVAALATCSFAASAQVKVLISGGFSGPYEKLLPEFERTTGIEVATGSGSSQGTGPQTIAAQLARGGPADVVINVKPTPRGRGAAAMVASGEADIAVMPVNEILHAPGVDFAGVIAEETHSTRCSPPRSLRDRRKSTRRSG